MAGLLAKTTAQAYTDIADGLFGPGASARVILGMPKEQYSAIDVLLATITSRMRLFALVADAANYDELKRMADKLCSNEKESKDAKIRMNAQLAQLLVLAGVKVNVSAIPESCPAWTQMQEPESVVQVKEYFESLRKELPSAYAEALERLTALRQDPAKTIKQVVDGVDLQTRNEVMDVLAGVAQDYAESEQAAARFRPLRSVVVQVGLYAALLLALLVAVLYLTRRVRSGRK